jgi:ribonuclease HI
VTLEARGGSQYTTNNRMELQAAIGALEALTRPGQEVEIRTDSSYLRDLASQWLPGWKRRGWKRPTGEPVANLDQVQRLDELLVAHRVRWTKVKGHSGEPGNERADRLAADAMDALAAGTEPAWTNRLSAPPFRINGR